MTSILALTFAATLSNTAAPAPAPRAALLTQTQRIVQQGAAFPESTRTMPARGGGDSVADGALIGGLIAGAASAVVLGYICHVFNETGDPICVKQVAWRSAVAAAAGALVGAGIDAMMDRQQFAPPSRPDKLRRGAIAGPSVRMRVRF